MSRWKSLPAADTMADEDSGFAGPDGPKTESVVDRDVELQGRLITRNPIKIDGKFNGQISCGDTLTVTSNGLVTGETETVNVVIDGHLEGEILARKRMEIQPGGVFYGELLVQPEVLVLAESAQFARERPKPEFSAKVVEMPSQTKK